MKTSKARALTEFHSSVCKRVRHTRTMHKSQIVMMMMMMMMMMKRGVLVNYY